VSSKIADIGISSTEAIVADQAAGAPVVSIAAIVAHNTSSLAARKDSGIVRPSQLQGKIYGGYGASYEEPVIDTMITHDGGKGTFKNVTLDTDGFEALRSRRVDFIWIFGGWQGVQAKREGLELVTFPIGEYGVPDYYTPNIITSPDTLAKKKDALRRFMTATARGYEYARTHPKEAAQMLVDEAPQGTFPDTGLVFESQDYLSPRYADQGKPWGVQTKESWVHYPKFMLEKKTVFDASGKPVTSIDFDALYTNELFQ
jgi:ABC-type nitrate/sulfonate/bicarbonate transport system substrate-binding protein